MTVIGDGGAGSGDIDNALTILRARIDEEFRITERLDSKARQAFALAAGFFAVVQTVAFGGFAQKTISSGEKVWLLGATVVAGLLLVRVGHRLTESEELLEEADVRVDVIDEWWQEAPADEPDYVSERLVTELRRVARTRAENNKRRTRKYDRIVDATRLALIFAGVELMTAILVRL